MVKPKYAHPHLCVGAAMHRVLEYLSNGPMPARDLDKLVHPNNKRRAIYKQLDRLHFFGLVRYTKGTYINSRGAQRPFRIVHLTNSGWEVLRSRQEQKPNHLNIYKSIERYKLHKHHFKCLEVIAETNLPIKDVAHLVSKRKPELGYKYLYHLRYHGLVSFPITQLYYKHIAINNSNPLRLTRKGRRFYRALKKYAPNLVSTLPELTHYNPTNRKFTKSANPGYHTKHNLDTEDNVS